MQASEDLSNQWIQDGQAFRAYDIAELTNTGEEDSFVTAYKVLG